MTVIFRDEISIVRLEKVKHFQILNNTVYFDFFDGAETIERDIEIIEVLA
jgi:hypothetical protein